MAFPRKSETTHELHCGWTDPRDRVNWHIRSFRDPAGVWTVAFRRSGGQVEHRAKNRFERPCDLLEDHELAALLDLAKKSPQE